jgi:hypothetical protein
MRIKNCRWLKPTDFEIMKKIVFLWFWFIAVCISSVFGQSNRMTNENGQLLWQYNQIVTLEEGTQNTIRVSFIFINGVNQTAISLRQELFHSQIEWIETAGIQVEKEERVEFVTANLAPHQSVVCQYLLKVKPVDKELLLEKSAILIMNEAFEVRKEIIPEQRVGKE